jgi:uncharacterized damage-inducible protein DinB
VSPTSITDGQRADLLATLAGARKFLRLTVAGLTEEQARQRPTDSALCLGGLIKHVAYVERGWASFMVDGPSALPSADAAAFASHAASFQLGDGETLDGVLSEYEQVAARTDDLVTSLPDLDASHPLPDAPWFEPGARWSARMAVLHIAVETAQHAGHADIIREAIDGAKSMG